jgi:hypothetical protein
MAAILLGSAGLLRAPLSSPEASSAEGLVVERWADRPARLARMDRLCALGLVACDAALVDAGVSPATDWRPERTAIVFASAFGCHATNEAYYRGYLAAGIEGASPRLFAYTLPSSPVGEITIHHKILGPASTTVAGLSSAIDAFIEALRHLEAGRADRILVAAADVGTPLLARLGIGEAQDSAAAVLLERGERGRTRVWGARSRFCAGDMERAARAAIAAVRLDAPSPTAIYAPESLRGALAGMAPFHALDPRALSAAPLLALRDARRDGEARALIVAADPAGQAGAVLLRSD